MPVPSPRTAAEASRLIRCTEAAARLDVEIHSVPGLPLRFELESFKDTADGERVSRRYVVDPQASTCTCPDFREHRLFCKHLIWLEPYVRRAEENIEAAIALYEQERQAEDLEYGRLFIQNLHTERSLLAS